MTTLGQNATLAERYNYAPETVTPEEILDALLMLEQLEKESNNLGDCPYCHVKDLEIDALEEEISSLESHVAELMEGKD